jgi:hypothetical protein
MDAKLVSVLISMGSLYARSIAAKSAFSSSGVSSYRPPASMSTRRNRYRKFMFSWVGSRENGLIVNPGFFRPTFR